jgi:hypothetical protein
MEVVMLYVDILKQAGVEIEKGVRKSSSVENADVYKEM